ncbi:scarecrow-like protein 23 [Amborella trichopoda]|uniref:scarecrow-like protein 23 n=1 Tax=Amborella trichopoda TaxID=13333 RepID=UPI0005D2FD45|nr:scarecrow-like protein 23 [Amborella trichopoda]|eukprot:XP_011621963.1 scarecrow-like protein 23 [Amborella trichopoda]
MDVTFTKLGFHEPETLSGLLMAFQAPEEQSKSTGSSSPINTPPISGTLNDQGKVPIADILEQTDHGTYPKKETAYPISLASLEILNSYSNLSRRLSGSSAVKQSTHVDPPIGGEKKLSTEEVMRIAGEQYLTTGENLSSPSIRDSSKLSHLTKEDVKNIELANLLLSSAEKISNQQYDRAKRLLMVCDFESSPVGNPVQRLVFHFADALWERAERETGMKSLKPEYIEREADVDKALRGYHPVVLAIYQAVPFGKLVQFTASQVIIGALDSATKIHVIDLEPRTGMQWTILMQSLSERSEYPVEHLKITMVGDSTGKMEETGTRLLNFAKTLKLPLVFKLITVSNVEQDMREDFLS